MSTKTKLDRSTRPRQLLRFLGILGLCLVIGGQLLAAIIFGIISILRD